MISTNGVDLCVQMFGDHAAPAILLIAGGAKPVTTCGVKAAGRTGCTTVRSQIGGCMALFAGGA